MGPHLSRLPKGQRWLDLQSVTRHDRPTSCVYYAQRHQKAENDEACDYTSHNRPCELASSP